LARHPLSSPTRASSALQQMGDIMCDIANEKSRIDAILEWAMTQSPVRHCVDEAKLAGYGLAVLRGCYSDSCPDECLRQRSAEYAAFIARSRRSDAHSSDEPLRRAG
jgi:hypothetical protein